MVPKFDDSNDGFLVALGRESEPTRSNVGLGAAHLTCRNVACPSCSTIDVLRRIKAFEEYDCKAT
jgi:hypothetical protein